MSAMGRTGRVVALGLNWEQNSTAALMIDGQIVGCVSEERFSRVKNDERYPKSAIDYLLSAHDVDPSEIEAVCYISTAWAPSYTLTRHYSTYSVQDLIEEQRAVWLPRLLENRIVSQVEAMSRKLDLDQYPGADYWTPYLSELKAGNDHASNSSLEELGRTIRREVVGDHLGIDPARVHFVDHHEGHAAYAYYSSPAAGSDALVLTLDAFGDHRNYTAFDYRVGDDGDPAVQLITDGDNFIIGRLYRYITLILGMKSNEHEYKVMGLAPYANEKYFASVLELFRSYQDVEGLHFVDRAKPADFYFTVREQLEGARFDAIAGAVQAYAEELIAGWVSNLLEQTGARTVCLAGGVAMNVKANALISQMPSVTALHVPASPDDSSQAMGALYAWAHGRGVSADSTPTQATRPLSHVYLGPSIDAAESGELVEALRGQEGMRVSTDVAGEAARVLASGGIVARASGGAEFGARALGNRSIMGDPRNLESKKKINDQIKSRDFWMPFAATVLEDYALEYLELDAQPSSYYFMTNTCRATELGKSALQAALHPQDLTCRPQLLRTGVNPGYEAIIRSFGDLTGVYGVLNTSMNFHGHPIVNSSADALDLFLRTDVDALVLGNHIVIRT
jgi:carbamoyltransferase